MTAILGGEADFMPSGVSAAARQINTGNMQGLAIVNAEEADIPSGSPAITNDIPEMKNFSLGAHSMVFLFVGMFPRMSSPLWYPPTLRLHKILISPLSWKGVKILS
ncbi:MAG: hypothetical protein ABJ370_14580 [Paracoccaceae bacterium]